MNVKVNSVEGFECIIIAMLFAGRGIKQDVFGEF